MQRSRCDSDGQDLTNRVAMVTGGGGGIGREIVRTLAKAGAGVAVVDADNSAAEATSNAMCTAAGDVVALVADVSDRRSVEAMVEAVLARWGRIDILVNAAGTSDASPALQLTDENWQRVLAVNLTGVFICSQVVGRHMVRQSYGRIVNISSVAGKFGAPGLSAYAASKAGVVGLTRVMAVELGPHGVTVNAVSPANIDTGMLESGLKKRAESLGISLDDLVEGMLAKTPVGRFGLPAEVAALVLFLVSPVAGYVTGQDFIICGGRSVALFR